MKMHSTVGRVVVVCGLASGFAADSNSLRFGGERIGVPPLSLSETIKDRAGISKRFDATLPEQPGNLSSPRLSPKLVPPTLPKMLQKSPPHPSRAPHVARDSGMPILVPSDAVDYKMTIIPPDPTLDFKLVIKDPGSTEKEERVSPK